ncbi:MAG TPA: hypothetical protein VHT75_00035 [Acidimicrobiales bacterium]|nr:hypothetical protein [Acidimicrobiales bacterium]
MALGLVLLALDVVSKIGLLWIAALIVALPVLAYRGLTKIVYELELDGSTLRWRSALRSGDIPVHEVVAVKCSDPWWNNFRQHSSIRYAGRKRLFFVRRPSFESFLDQLIAANPAIKVDPKLRTRKARWGY